MGLKIPPSAFPYTVKNKNYTINIGNKISDDSGENSYYAVMIKGNPAIFLVEESLVSALFTKADDYASKTVYSCNITKLKTVTFTKDGVSTTFNLAFNPDDDSDLTVTAGSKTVDTAAFRQAYADFLSISTFEKADGAKDADSPYVTVSFTYRDYPGTDTVRFSPSPTAAISSASTAREAFSVLSTGLDKFVSSISALI